MLVWRMKGGAIELKKKAPTKQKDSDGEEKAVPISATRAFFTGYDQWEPSNEASEQQLFRW